MNKIRPLWHIALFFLILFTLFAGAFSSATTSMELARSFFRYNLVGFGLAVAVKILFEVTK